MTVTENRLLEEVNMNMNISVPRNYVMMTHIVKQLPDAETGKKFKKMVKDVEVATKSSFIITIASNIFFAGSMYLIWGVVNTL